MNCRLKILHYSILAIFLGFAGLILSYDNTAYGIWVRQSPQELLNGSSTIFVGNITSTNVLQLEKEFRYTTEVNGTDKDIVQNYTLNLDEYKVDVEEFLKNPQNTNKITVRQPTIGLPSGLGGLDEFKTGERILFYIKNLDGINEYSPESFIIPKSCDAKDVLTQKRLEARGESIIIQNGIKLDNNFTANKPIQFVDNEDVDTLSGKSLDVQVYMTKTVGNGAEVVFRKEIHAVAKPCEWIASAKWEFTPQEGEYGVAVRITEDNTTYSQYYGKFSVKSPVISQYSPTLEDQFGNPTQTKLVHDNAILILNQTTEKWIYKSGEDMIIIPKIINIGNKTVNIRYPEPTFFLEIKNQYGDVIYPQSAIVAYIPEFGGVKALKPGEQFGVKPWTTPTAPMYDPSPIVISTPGNYTAISVVSFKFDSKTGSPDSYEYLWSKPTQITILPEKIPEFPFVVPILLASFVSVIVFYGIRFRK